jgi:lipopolysaccharide/colanic/teichoic acid biosynthesis glycosyltransferase
MTIANNTTARQTIARQALPPSPQAVAPAQPSTVALPCALRWRQGQLWVSSVVRGKDIALPALGQPEWFRACLSKSKARVVCIDPALGTEVISLWAAACQEAQKPLYLRIPASPHLPAKQKPLAWAVKRGCDRLAALLLLLLFSPVMLAIAALIKLDDGGPLFATEWRVGERGRLFQVLNFRTIDATAHAAQVQSGIHPPQPQPPHTWVGRLLRQSYLAKLPLLLNVLRGELSLVGPHPWSIYETLMLPTSLHTRIHTLPCISGTLQTFAHFPVQSPKLVQRIARQDLQYLGQWSLWQDAKQLTASTLRMLDLTL